MNKEYNVNEGCTLTKIKTRLQAKIGCEQRCSDFIKSRNDVFWM